MVLGSLGLLALFGVVYALSGGADVTLNGDQIEAATAGAAGPADGADDTAVIDGVAMSGTDGEVRSFGSDSTGSIRGNDGAGLALRVVTDPGPAGSTGSVTSDGATTPSNSSATSSAPSSTAGSAASDTSPTTAGSSTGSSSTKAPTTAKETTTTQRRTSTTKAAASSSSTASTAAPTTATTATTAAPTTRPPTTSGSSSNARNFEQEVIRLTNEERAAGGCGPLTNNDMLHAAALGHSVDMAENDYFSHTSRDASKMVDRVERQGYRWRSLAENIAAGYRSAAAVVEGWMNSSGHRDNIMNCGLTEIGVGFHNYYWTQNFGTPR